MNSKSFREGTIVTSLAFCDFSYTIYPEKNPGPLPASSSSQLSTHRKHLVHQHPRLTSHLTVDKQDWLLYSLVDTRRRTAVESTERLEAGADFFYECGLAMTECYPSKLIHGHFNPSTVATAAAARWLEVTVVYVPCTTPSVRGYKIGWEIRGCKIGWEIRG